MSFVLLMVCAAAGGMAFGVAEERRKIMDIIGLGVRSTYQREASEKNQDRVRGSGFSDYLSARTQKGQTSRDAYVPSVRQEAIGCELYERQGVGARDTVGDSEEGITNYADREETGGVSSKTNIIVKSDGSRVLMVTMNIGGMETNMSIKISEATDMQDDSNSPNNTTQQGQAAGYMPDGDMAEN